MQQKAKNFFSATVSLALAALVIPFFAIAAVPTDTLVKGPGKGAAVYYFANDGKRYVFPNQKTYNSWFTNFNGVVEVTPAELASMPLGGNVTYRPGIKMIKITTDPKVYAIDKGGLLRWVTTEEIARKLYGSTWNTKIDDVADTFFVNYHIGSPIYSTGEYTPFAATQVAATINADKSLNVTSVTRISDTSPDVGDAATFSGFLSPVLSNAAIIDRATPATALLYSDISTGSGVVIDPAGLLLTNAHVVEGLNDIGVAFSDGRLFTAVVVGRDEKVDLAILRLPTSSGPWPYLAIETETPVRSGDDAFSFGYPLTSSTISAGLFSLSPSFKEGTISRVVTGSNGVKYFEISADIHPGNSGGALLNDRGKLIGVPTRAVAQLVVEGVILGETIKYAISNDVVSTYLPFLKLGWDVRKTTGASSPSPTPSPTPSPSPSPAPSPTPSTCADDTWSCTAWNACPASETQTRVCTMTFDCPGATTPKPTESQSCMRPALTLSLSSTPASQTYIQGAQGAQLLGINFKANEGADVRVSSLKLTGYIDDDANGTFEKGVENSAIVANDVAGLKLWRGTTQIGQTKSLGAGNDGTVTFDGLSLIIPKGQTITITLTGNLASSITTTPDRIKFDITAASDVIATDPDGNAVSNINQATGASFNGGPFNTGTRITILASGTVSVSKAPDDSETEARIVIGGGSNVVLGKYTLSAQSEELKLTKARLTVAGPTAVSTLSLYDGSLLVGGPASPDGAGVVDFTNVNFVIPKDGSKTLTVKGNLNSVGASGASSGVNAKVTLDNNDNFEVRGTSAGSNTLLSSFGTGDAAGNDKILRKTKPTISLVALPSTSLTDGQTTIMRFTVTADAGERVSLKALTAEIMATGATATPINVAESAVRRVGDASPMPGSSNITGNLLTTRFTDEEVIAAGTSRTYDLRILMSGVSSNDSVSTRLLGDSTIQTGTISDNGSASSNVNSTPSNFGWSDNSASPHSGTNGASSTDWANGYLTKVLPTDTQTLTN